MATDPFNHPFQEQVDFLKQKLNLPSETWHDIRHAAHDRGFMVAGAQGADLLDDLHGAINEAAQNGTGLNVFRKNFNAIVAKHGWTGWTGEGTDAGVAWRTKVIYQTNMATSYAAGRWKQLNDPELLKLLPYWQYQHSHSVITPRPLHLAWDGLTLPPDHPFWKTHFPPNGWGCQCRVTAVSKSDYLKAVASGRGPANAPTGLDGIDPGFGYAPGANVDTPLRQIVQEKLISYPPAITKALSADVNRYINASSAAEDFARASLTTEKSSDVPLWIGFVQNFQEIQAVTGKDVQGYLVLIPADAVRHAGISHGFDGGNQRAPKPSDYSVIWNVLANADNLSRGNDSRQGNESVVAIKRIGEEIYRCVFEIRSGKKGYRALTLLSLAIKV